MQSIVAIDIETTGLSEERDAIIEIGAVKFKGHRVEDEWSTLLNPDRHIPEFVSGLTGISDAEVRNAPRFHEDCRGSWKHLSVTRRSLGTTSVSIWAFCSEQDSSNTMRSLTPTNWPRY